MTTSLIEMAAGEFYEGFKQYGDTGFFDVDSEYLRLNENSEHLNMLMTELRERARRGGHQVVFTVNKDYPQGVRISWRPKLLQEMIYDVLYRDFHFGLHSDGQMIDFRAQRLAEAIVKVLDGR